jgi:hypothetical protein
MKRRAQTVKQGGNHTQFLTQFLRKEVGFEFCSICHK